MEQERIFPNVKCTDNLMEFTWFSPLRVWLQKIELQSHHHILDLLQLTCRQEERTITSTLRFHGYILNRGRIQTRIQDKLFPSSRKQSCDWAAFLQTNKAVNLHITFPTVFIQYASVVQKRNNQSSQCSFYTIVTVCEHCTRFCFHEDTV